MIKNIREKAVKYRQEIMAVAAIAVIYLILSLIGIGCPIKFFTGVSCAGCGMTRAWLKLFRMDLSGAYYYHPLFWLPVPVAAVLLFRNKMNKILFNAVIIMAVFLLFAVYIVRMLNPEDTVVVFKPMEGFLLGFLAGGNL